MEALNITARAQAARGLPASYYTSAAVFAEEMERIFSRHWLCVGRASALGNAGDYVLADVCGESVIVVRGADAVLRAFYNVCRHRGTRICTEPAGNLRGALQCPYHAWTYGLDGRLISARNMQDVPGFNTADYALAPVALATWEGFVFVCLDVQAPFAQAYAPLSEKFARWHLPELRSAKRIEYDLRCNWKLVFQNYSECYHCPLIHPALNALSPWDSGRNDMTSGAFLGGFMTLRPGSRSMTMDGRSSRPLLGRLDAADAGRVYYYTLFPTVLLSLHSDYVMVHRVIPVEAARTRVVCEWLFDRDAAAAAGFDCSDAVDFWDMTNRQDWHACELSQLGLGSRAYQPGPYSNSEALLAAFDSHYLDLMG